MTRVYYWMTGGILLSAWVAYAVSQNAQAIERLVRSPLLFWGLIIAQFGSVFFLTFAINHINALMATIIYLLYAGLTGITLSFVFLLYTHDSIFSTFLVTAVAFGGLSFYGATTKRDLGPVGTFCTMGLFGLIGFALLSLFIPSMRGSSAQMAYSAVGLLIFSGLTAYDTQKIKAMNVLGNEGTDEDRQEAIVGALTLYLDFINLFLDLLRLMGNRRE